MKPLIIGIAGGSGSGKSTVARRVAEIDATWADAVPLEERARAAADEWLEKLVEDPTPLLLRLELTGARAFAA